MLKKLAIAGLVAGTALSFVPAANAAPAAEGRKCTFFTTTDPQVEGSMTGEINAGPIVLDSSNPAATGNVTCTLQTGVNDTHAEADAAVLTGPQSTGAAVAAGTVTFEVGAEEDVYICTKVNVGGTVYFWDVASGSWSVSGGLCAIATSIETPPIGTELDPIVCPYLDDYFPPDGDVANVWDCPPYES